MKKFLLFSLTFLVPWLIPLNRVGAQKTGGNKVTIQITRDGKMVSDTTIQLKEGQDPEAVKKIIGHVLEGDIQVISGKESAETVIVGSGDKLEVSEGKEGGEKVIIITEKGDEKPGDHQKKIKVYVTEGDGDVEIIDNENLELHKDKDADSVDVYIIKSEDGTKVIKKAKKVTVTVEEESEDNDMPAEHPAEPAPKPGKKK